MRDSLGKAGIKAEEGRQKMEWAFAHMPILKLISREVKERETFKGIKIAACLHIEAKTANFVCVLKDGGAEVSLAGSNPLSTQDDVVKELQKRGIKVYAERGESSKKYFDYLNKTLDIVPDIIIDDGGDLINLVLSKRKELVKGIIGGCEETTTGVLREKAFEKKGILKFPVIAVNNGKCKYLFDNRYGTGQSAWDGIIRTTNVNIAGKNVVIAGYGWVGKGIAQRGKGLGAHIIITEVNPVNALEAHMDGFLVLPMEEAAKVGDIFVTCTSNRDVINGKHIRLMKEGAILANAGHFNVEIAMDELEKEAIDKKEVRKNITEYTLPDKRHVYVLGDGRLVNLACADGHPIEIMDMSFSLQLLSVKYLLENANKLQNKVYDLPEAIDNEVADLALKAYGIKIDHLTTKQKKYFKGPNL